MSLPNIEPPSEGKDASSATTVPVQMEILGGIHALTNPNYHQLNVHCARNDRLLHATLCAYAKWHLDAPDIGSDQLSTILFDAICESIGDNAFCEWVETIRKGK